MSSEEAKREITTTDPRHKRVRAKLEVPNAELLVTDLEILLDSSRSYLQRLARSPGHPLYLPDRPQGYRWPVEQVRTYLGLAPLA